MKKYILVFICICALGFIRAQDNTIKNLEIRIEAAALEEDYAKAAKLTKELNARIELEKAVEEKDYERAAELKEELKRIEAEGTTDASVSNSSGSVKVKAVKGGNGGNSYMFANGGFVDGLIGISPRTILKLGLGAVGIKLGTKWYFGNGNVYRPGVQAVWFKPVLLYNTNGGGILMEVNALNIGLANAIAINDKLGVEVNFGVGFSHLIASFSNYAYANGLNITPDVKFRHKNLAVGMEFSNSIYLRNNFSVNTYSFTIGGRF